MILYNHLKTLTFIPNGMALSMEETEHLVRLPRIPCGTAQTSNWLSSTGTLALPLELFLWLLSVHLHTVFLSPAISGINASLSSIAWHYFKKQPFKTRTAFQNAFFHITEHAFREVTRDHFSQSKCVSCSQQHSPITVMFLFQKVSLLCQQQPF